MRASTPRLFVFNARDDESFFGSRSVGLIRATPRRPRHPRAPDDPSQRWASREKSLADLRVVLITGLPRRRAAVHFDVPIASAQLEELLLDTRRANSATKRVYTPRLGRQSSDLGDGAQLFEKDRRFEFCNTR